MGSLQREVKTSHALPGENAWCFLPGQVSGREQLWAVSSPCAGGPGQGTSSIYLQREGRAVAETHIVLCMGEIGHAASGKERAEQFF